MSWFSYPYSSSDEMERCSLKVLELEGSPTRSLLRLMGDRGCLLKDLLDFLQAMDHTEALQCIKPAGIHICNIYAGAVILCLPCDGLAPGPGLFPALNP